MQFQDSAIVVVYVEFDVPCDRLVANQAKLLQFRDRYRQMTGHAPDLTELGEHLLNLRRRGEAKGGLPRLRRGYSGRGAWRN